MTKLYDLASTILEQKLSQIQGVGQVGVQGGATPSVRVEVNPTKLESFGLTLGNVQSVLSLQNSHEPRGQLSDNGVSEDIITNDQISQAADYRPLVVGYHNGEAVRLSDVADVVDSTQNIRAAGYQDGKHGQSPLSSSGSRAPTSFRLSTASGRNCRFLRPRFPKGIKHHHRARPHHHHSRFRLDRGKDPDWVHLPGYSGGLPVPPQPARHAHSQRRCPGLSHRNLRCNVPVRLSLDNLSLMALTIATGFVVDDAIVVMENITRHLESGMEPFAAALKGAQEIGFTVFSISMSLIAVFIPILMMGGIVGRLFREFAVTLSTAIVISMVISLTTTPCMCAHVLKAHKEGEKHNWLYRANEKVFNGIDLGVPAFTAVGA